MAKDNGGNNERQLFHGTDAKNIRAINAKGFNRSFTYGRGVYFAKDTSFSVRYTGGAGIGAHYVYLARVLVGKYCLGSISMEPG
ncbi:unnamed protein product [Porites evermanni]|uniref:Poly [ADP-ribose] polymerase n=1 Tax=Porites evermanni TaxID=104178 RepID=A0ABN8RSV9_9CNID|nr:unnamed protein product [Porites evermanni]